MRICHGSCHRLLTAASSAILGAVFAVALVATPPAVLAAGEEGPEHDRGHAMPTGHAHYPTNVWDIARGGQLYDNWFAVLELAAPSFWLAAG